MNATELPAPLVPPDVDCTDLDGFMLNVERLMASELVALSSHEVIGAALLLWCRAWKQRPAASLPNDNKVIAAFARMPLARFLKLRNEVMRGFVLCSDGRLYHRTLALEAMRSFGWKESSRRKRDADAERLRKWRSGHASETLRETPRETQSETRFVAEGQDRTGQDMTGHGEGVQAASPPARKRAPAPARTLAADDLAQDGVDPQHARDWLAVRKAKDLPLTRTAWESTKAEAAKAGITVAQAVQAAAANGWGGFRASWMTGRDVPINGARTTNRQLAVEAENKRVLGEWLGQQEQPQ